MPRSTTRVRVVIDIAFGDVVEPGVQEADLPVLLDFVVPKLRSYLRETVIAEKFQAMIALGLANSRLKDFYVVWVLIRSQIRGGRASAPIKATFERRKTETTSMRPDVLTRLPPRTPAKDQWAAFTKQVAVDPGPPVDVANNLAEFLMPQTKKARALKDGAAA